MRHAVVPFLLSVSALLVTACSVEPTASAQSLCTAYYGGLSPQRNDPVIGEELRRRGVTSCISNRTPVYGNDPDGMSPSDRAAANASSARAAAAEAALTLTERTVRDREAAKSARETELLQRALTGSPDYTAAVRRAAEANVAAEPSVSRRPEARQAREARIAAEETRLSDAIEMRRREALLQAEQNQLAARRTSIRAACDTQASIAGSSSYTPYSPRAGILGSALVGAINSSAAEEQVRAACYRANGL